MHAEILKTRNFMQTENGKTWEPTLTRLGGKLENQRQENLERHCKELN